MEEISIMTDDYERCAHPPPSCPLLHRPQGGAERLMIRHQSQNELRDANAVQAANSGIVQGSQVFLREFFIVQSLAVRMVRMVRSIIRSLVWFGDLDMKWGWPGGSVFR